MWLASYLSHFGRLHWKLLADWTHYHFLDGDIASNHLSWQWVASTFSSKPYFFTSENTERYGNFSVKELTGSYDEVWENISDIHRVGPFEECTDGAGILQTDLSRFPVMTSLPSDHILLLTPWSLSETLVQAYPEHTPVLIFDTNFFERYPMSPKRIDFISEYAEKL